MNQPGTQSTTEHHNDAPFAGQSYSESIDTAIATIQESQIELSHMADTKANIMITVSSILLTLAIGRFEQDSLVIPSMLLALFCVPALIFAILCVMPSAATSRKPIDKTETLEHFNPLFFMHFTLLPMKRYEQEISRVLTDPQVMYQTLTRDIYHAGMVLRTKKYRYLRWSYLSLLLSVLSGCIALLLEFVPRL